MCYLRVSGPELCYSCVYGSGFQMEKLNCRELFKNDDSILQTAGLYSHPMLSIRFL